MVVANDVRAATWGEWLHGAGQGAEDLICLFIGTGIGGGVVSGGRMLSGLHQHRRANWGTSPSTSTAPRAPAATGAASRPWPGAGPSPAGPGRPSGTTPPPGMAFLKAAGLKEPVALEDVNAAVVAAAARAHDPLARLLVDEVARALIAGTVGLVNAFNPCRLILGGGVMQGLPELTGRIDAGIRGARPECRHRALRGPAGET